MTDDWWEKALPFVLFFAVFVLLALILSFVLWGVGGFRT